MTSTTQETSTVQFKLGTSSGHRESCWLCEVLVDKLEVAAEAEHAGVGGNVSHGPVCLNCILGGEDLMRIRFNLSIADHREEIAWCEAQGTLDRTQFDKQIFQALRRAVELTDHLAADEQFLAASWDVPDRGAVAAYLALDHRYWCQVGDGDSEAIDDIRNRTGVTVEIPAKVHWSDDGGLVAS